jgi:hypothetical protein
MEKLKRQLLNHNGQSQKIEPQRRREKLFVIVNRAAGAVNPSLYRYGNLCALCVSVVNAFNVFDVCFWLEADC